MALCSKDGGCWWGAKTSVKEETCSLFTFTPWGVPSSAQVFSPGGLVSSFCHAFWSCPGACSNCHKTHFLLQMQRSQHQHSAWNHKLRWSGSPLWCWEANGLSKGSLPTPWVCSRGLSILPLVKNHSMNLLQCRIDTPHAWILCSMVWKSMFNWIVLATCRACHYDESHCIFADWLGSKSFPFWSVLECFHLNMCLKLQVRVLPTTSMVPSTP